MTAPAKLESLGRITPLGLIRGVQTESIRDESRIDRVLRALARLRARGRVVDDAGRVMGVIVAVPRGTRSGGALRWDYDGPPLPGNVVVEIAGPLSLYRFHLRGEPATDGQIETAAPLVIERVRTRREPRVCPPPNSVVRFYAAGGRPIKWPVEDVSHRGLAVAPAASSEGLRPGAVISDAVVEWGGRLRIRMDLHVRHVSEQFGDGQRVAGVEIAFASPDDARHWEGEIDALSDSTTRSGGSWTRDLFELYERSGYFDLSSKNPAEFEHLREAFQDSSRKLARAPDLGVQIVWPSVRGVEASLSLIALNHHALFLFHVARRHGNTPADVTGRVILHSIYSRAIGWIATTGAKWLVVWVQDAGDFSKRLHLDFVKRYVGSSRASVVPFRALEIPTRLVSETRLTSAAESGGRASEWQVRAARDVDTETVTQILAAALPPSSLDSLGLTPPFQRRWSAWDDSSLLRGRDIVIAERDGRIGAVAVLECAEDGIHLFGLLDLVRIVSPTDSPGAREALIAHAREMFQQIGKRLFIFAADPDLAQEDWPAGATDLGITHSTVMSTELLPQFADHLWELSTGGAG